MIFTQAREWRIGHRANCHTPSNSYGLEELWGLPSDEVERLVEEGIVH